MTKLLTLLLAVALAPLTAAGQDTPNARQARRIFDEAYQKVFGPQGATLHYDVNIIGVYKTQGTIWYKGKKNKFVDEKVDAYNDGKTAYMCYRKKKVVEIHAANSDKKDKYSGKFTFDLDNFDYHIADDAEGLLITMKARKALKGIREVRALLDRRTRAPIRLRVKVAFVWTTIKISNFRSGGIDDTLFN